MSAPYPPDLRGEVRVAVRSWEKFYALPQDIKDQFPYAGTGYEVKRGEGPAEDFKENFHVNLADLRRLREIAAQVLQAEASVFIESATRLIECMVPFVGAFAQQVENIFGVPGFCDKVVGSRDLWVLRYLHYFSDVPVGTEVATPHPDKSAYTYHLYESHRGLQYLTWDGKWQDMPVEDDKTVIIAGMQLQYLSESRLKALCHRVIVTSETTHTGRVSMVCFIPLPSHPFNKSCKGRLQEFPPGFNYDLPHEKFSELFL